MPAKKRSLSVVGRRAVGSFKCTSPRQLRRRWQINNYYWCQPANGRFSYNECALSCNALLTDDITNAVRCAQKIQRQQGWSAWSTWKFCNGALPSINDCF
ncbi:maker628 [Drosophila busckii]|uniref:lysozyme n=1 Tax=Drosophila busckii TaxID=30019 RepID=A0A0M4EBY1_DROBS|nr:maker628 [Drosophila busckii]